MIDSTNTQISDTVPKSVSELICKHSEKENGLQDLMEIMIESMMVVSILFLARVFE